MLSSPEAGGPADPVRDLVMSLALPTVDRFEQAFGALGARKAQAVIGAVLGLSVTDRFGTTRDPDAIAEVVRELRAAAPNPAEVKPMIAESVIRVVLGEAELRRWIDDEDFVLASIDIGRGLLRQREIGGEELAEFIGRVEDALRQAEAYQAAGGPGREGS